MKINDIIRAWKDPEFRATQKNLPESPAGLVVLEGAELDAVGGAVQEVAISITDTSGCTVSGWQISCGYVCTATTECTC
jgi:mersacidin/lichenicidin family type 2 lantibiotic